MIANLTENPQSEELFAVIDSLDKLMKQDHIALDNELVKNVFERLVHYDQALLGSTEHQNEAPDWGVCEKHIEMWNEAQIRYYNEERRKMKEERFE